ININHSCCLAGFYTKFHCFYNSITSCGPNHLIAENSVDFDTSCYRMLFENYSCRLAVITTKDESLHAPHQCAMKTTSHCVHTAVERFPSPNHIRETTLRSACAAHQRSLDLRLKRSLDL